MSRGGYIDLELFGSQGVKDILDDVFDILGDNANLRGAATGLLDRIKDRFIKNVDPWGTPWVQSRSGKRRRAKLGSPFGTLYDTGTLFKGLTVRRIGDFEWDLTDDVPYAEQHDEGLNGQVKREFMNFNDGDVQFVEDYLNTRISRALKKRGL